MADAQPSNAVPFPQGILKDKVPTVNMCSPWQPLVERVAVPALWFGLGVLVCKLMSKSHVIREKVL